MFKLVLFGFGFRFTWYFGLWIVVVPKLGPVL